MEKGKTRRGFTLVELIVVLNMAAILFALLIPVYQSVHGTRREAVCKSQLLQISNALQQFQLDNGRFPEYLGELYPNYVQTKGLMRCPADLRNQSTTTPTNGGYGYDLLYVKREVGEPEQELMDGCPYHKKALVMSIDGHIGKGTFQNASVTISSGTCHIIRWNADWQNDDWRRGDPPNYPNDPVPAGSTLTLRVGDTVVTEANGQATVQMDQKNSVVTIYPNTEFTLNLAETADDPNSLIRLSTARPSMSATQALPAHVNAKVDPSGSGVYLRGGGRFEISTPSAVAAVRGTVFDLWVVPPYETGSGGTVPGYTVLKVQNGTVDFIGEGVKRKVTPASGAMSSKSRKGSPSSSTTKNKGNKKKH